MSIRLLVVSDGLVPSGLARVTHSILRRLCNDRYDIHHLAINYNGDPHQENWKIYPAAVVGDHYGFKRLEELVRKIRPDIVWTYHDPWIQREYLRILRAYTDVLRVVTYTPVESEPVDPKWLEDIDVAARFVVFSSFAREAVVTAVGGKYGHALETIPHGGRASGSIVLFLNQDTTAFPGWFEPLLMTFGDPTVGVVGAKLVFPASGRTELLVQSCGGSYHADLEPYHRCLGWPAEDPRLNRRTIVSWVTGAALAIRRELFWEIGGFDEGYRCGYFEDVDLCEKAKQEGTEVWYCPDAVFCHRVGSTGGVGAAVFRANSSRFHAKWDECIRARSRRTVGRAMREEAKRSEDRSGCPPRRAH